MASLGVAVIVKLEPDFSEGNVSYNSDGTLNRAETKNILGPHSAVASAAAFYAKVNYGSEVSITTMGPPMADYALQQAQLISDADRLYLYSDRIFAGADTLATAEVLRAGIKLIENHGTNIDIVFSGHRASDGETGQTGPQTAWKLGYTFLGNVISYDVDIENRKVRARRLISLQGFYDVIEEVEASLPVFMTVDPSYKANYDTITQRLAFMRYKKNASNKSQEYKKYLQTLNAQQLGVDPKFVGLPGSPTIVYKVEKIPKAKPTRKALVVDGSDPHQIKEVVMKMNQALSRMVIK
jgi:electron transfer flavoprotein beta subunit